MMNLTLDSLIKGNLQTCCIFDDQLSDNKINYGLVYSF